MEIIEMKNLKVRQTARDWEEAIHKVGNILVENKCITNDYIESMIDAVKKYGPYMVIMPGLALAHAEPSDSVIKTSIAMMTLKEPVKFNCKNDPVKVMLCLACKDRTEHIKKLQVIAEKLMQDNIILKMLECTTEKELYNLININ